MHIIKMTKNNKKLAKWIWGKVSKDATQFFMNHIYVDQGDQGPILIATCGRQLVTMSADRIGIRDHVEIGGRVEISGDNIIIHSPNDPKFDRFGTYPHWKRVVPEKLVNVGQIPRIAQQVHSSVSIATMSIINPDYTEVPPCFAASESPGDIYSSCTEEDIAEARRNNLRLFKAIVMKYVNGIDVLIMPMQPD